MTGFGPFGASGSPFGSRTARAAAQRRLERGVRAILIRLRRAGVTFVGLLGALVIYNMTAGWVGFFTFLSALVTIALASFLILFFPVRDRSASETWTDGPVIDGKAVVPLDRLAAQTEQWLLDRSRALPREAGPALDRIVGRLRDLQPSLAALPAETQLGGEAQRLIGRHLPGLVTTYLSLPPSDRAFQAENGRGLAESLTIVAGQMDDLCERVAHDRRMGFETERRFIETRYSEDERLRPDGKV